jgi:hypothetical protein
MHKLFLGGLFVFALHATNLSAVEYQSFNIPWLIVTGIRSDSSTTDSVVITGNYTLNGTTTAALYQGSLAGVVSAPIESWNVFAPVFDGQTVTDSTFYGPNTSLFSPSTIPSGQVRAVGSYKYDENPAGASFNSGMMYLGPVNGSGGTWTQLSAASLVSEGTILNTLAHSTMGNLVVGNYDTSLATGKAFIYDIVEDSWFNLNPGETASVTAYGIWQNSETSYTIAGGASDVLNSSGLDYGYLLNYNSATQQISNFTKFNFDNQPFESLISHFDGITATETGFNLTGIYLSLDDANAAVGFFASVSFDSLTGEFGHATWVDIAFPGAEATTGNTVVGDSVLGIYLLDGVGTSYVATVPEPSTGVLFAVVGGLGLIRFLRRRKSAETEMV